MARLCTICARGGSKGVPNKNLREVAGRPLLLHSIEAARRSGLFDLIAVGSDSPEILAAARTGGADLVIERPAELASDSAAKLPAIRHCASEAAARSGLAFSVTVDLDVTSPLRLPDDIVGAVALLEQSGCANVITGAPARRSPYFNLVEVGVDGVARLSKTLAQPVVRRQDAPACFDMNASVYVWRWPALFDEQGLFRSDTRLYVMPEERSLDIDSELDLRIVTLLLEERERLAAARQVE
ncbi:acylneuraminate cytidylyltransferase family protein [Chitinimonas lacunae]|uniref:Cytidylyltransferase domain-containing protein n=1 Tax=Chitinimonas lacunae TaxID=1963018 RepID=A0ABV8MTF7_9NEIS